LNDCPNCEYHKDRAARWRAEAYRQAGHDVIERPWVGLTDEEKQEWIDAMPWPPQQRHIRVLIDGIESEIKGKNEQISNT
jgi:hypothetical protein